MYKWIIYFHHLCALLRCWADVRAPSYFVSLMLHSFFLLLTVIAHIYWHAPLVIGFKSRNPVMIRWSESNLCIWARVSVPRTSKRFESHLWIENFSSFNCQIYQWYIELLEFIFWNFTFLKKISIHHEFLADSTIS